MESDDSVFPSITRGTSGALLVERGDEEMSSAESFVGEFSWARECGAISGLGERGDVGLSNN